MKAYRTDADDMRPDRKIDQVKHAQAHHVPVEDIQDTQKSVNSSAPLSAYMVSPQYLPRDVIKRTAPKRPLGSSAEVGQIRSRIQHPQAAARQPKKQPVKMYNQVATFGSMDRIRRPRNASVHQIPIYEASHDSAAHDEKIHDKSHAGTAYIAAATGAIAASLVWVRNKAANTGRFMVRAFHRLPFVKENVRYSSDAGAAFRRFGVRENWLRISVPVVILLFMLGAGLFNVMHMGSGAGGNGANGSSNGASAGQNGNGGVVQVQQSANHAGGTGGSSSGNPSNGSNGAAANKSNGTQASTTSGGSQTTGNRTGQSGGTTASGGSAMTATGGMGGGGGYAAPVTISGGSPSYSTGSNTVTQAAPTPTYSAPVSSGGGSGGGSSSGGSTGGTSGGSGGISLPVDPTTPLPTTVTVPSTGVSAGGKNIVSTSPISGTLN